MDKYERMVQVRRNVNHLPPPSIVAISIMTAERVELYQHVPLPGQPIPVGVQPLPVDDSIPEVKKIAWAVRRLFLNLSGGPLVMQV